VLLLGFAVLARRIQIQCPDLVADLDDVVDAGVDSEQGFAGAVVFAGAVDRVGRGGLAIEGVSERKVAGKGGEIPLKLAVRGDGAVERPRAVRVARGRGAFEPWMDGFTGFIVNQHIPGGVCCRRERNGDSSGDNRHGR
jgi:hypothetical protein